MSHPDFDNHRRAMGESPSFSANGGGKVSLEGLVASLRSLPGDDEGRPIQHDRLLTRIFHKLEGTAAQHPSPGPLTAEQTLAAEIDAIFEADEPESSPTAEFPEQIGRSHRKRILAGLAALLVLVSTLAASQGSVPQTPLYGVKTKVETIRMYAARSLADKAARHISVAGDRLAMLRSAEELTASQIRKVAGEMDKATLSALVTIRSSMQTEEIIQVTGRLYGLAISQTRLIPDVLEVAPRPSHSALHQSLSTALRVVAATSSLLEPTGTVPSSVHIPGRVHPPMSSGTKAIGAAPLTSRKGQTSSGGSDKSVDDSTVDGNTTVHSTPGDDNTFDEETCGQGSICISVPSVPHLTVPSVPSP